MSFLNNFHLRGLPFASKTNVEGRDSNNSLPSSVERPKVPRSVLALRDYNVAPAVDDSPNNKRKTTLANADNNGFSSSSDENDDMVAKETKLAKMKTPKMKKTKRQGTSVITPTPRAKVTKTNNNQDEVTPTPRAKVTKTNNNQDEEEEDKTNASEEEKDDASPQKMLKPKQVSRSASAKSKTKKLTRQPPAKRGIRVKSRRSQLFHCIPTHLQKHLPQEHPNYHNCYGTVTKKSIGRKAAYDVQFDVFRGNEIAQGLRREQFTTVKHGEEEAPVDKKYLAKLHLEDDMIDAELKDEVEVKTEKDFINQDASVLREATSVTISFNEKKDPITWNILPADEDISSCPAFAVVKDQFDDGPSISPLIDFERLSNAELFLDHLFPNVAGMAQRMDECYQDNRAKHYMTYKSRKMKIHDANDVDPDWKIKQWLLLTIKGATVHGTGVETFWKAGMLEGNLKAADFGQFMDQNEHKVVSAAMPFIWGDRNLWYRDKRDVPWDVFMPFIDAWNDKQKELLERYHHVVCDETMYAWVPKQSKLGGLPNCACEPRKPKPLGTMCRDSSECATELMLHTDPIMPPTVQDKKMFSLKHSQAPDCIGTNKCHAPHVADTLRQAYYSNLQSGDWTCGDSHFGSMATCLALKLETATRVNKSNGAEVREPLGVDSSFVIKNNSSLFPKAPLRAVMKARYPKRMAGHWVVFTTTVQGVNIKAIAHAWCNTKMSFIITTVGTTTEAVDPYVSFDANTGFDGGDTKMLPRPEIVDFFFRFLPHIDVSNGLRQHSIKIEDQWPTKCCWLKLLICYIGQSVVNQRKLLAYKYPQVPGKDMKPMDMAASVSSALRLRVRSVLPRQMRLVATEPLSRVKNSEGHATKRLTDKERHTGKRSKGSSIQRSCYVCRKYKEKHSMATGACQHCGTCLCLTKKCAGRSLSCQEEHMTSNDPAIRCNGIKKSSFPKASRASNFIYKSQEQD